MAKKKKSKAPMAVPDEVAARIDRICTVILERLPVDDPAELVSELAADVTGYEPVLIEALAKFRTMEVLQFLYRLLPVLKEKAALKAAKSAIYRLEQSGLKVDDQVRTRGAPLVKAPAERKSFGYLGEYDAAKSRLGILALPGYPSGYDAALFMVNQVAGLQDFHTAHVPPGELKRMLRDLGGESPIGLVEVPPPQARYVLNEAAVRTQDQGLVIPEEYSLFVGQAGSVALPDRSLIYDYVPAEEIEPDDGALQFLIPDLFNHPVMAGFMVLDELDPYFRKMEEIRDSTLVLSKVQQEERVSAVFSQAQLEIFDSKSKAVLKRQLEESALLLWLMDEAKLARAALAAALDLDRQAGALTPHPFVREMVLRSFGVKGFTTQDIVLGGSDFETEDKSVSGLVLPYDVRK